VPECPVEGCNYTGVPRSVAAHYSGKQDDDHSGGYHDAKAMIEGRYDATQEDMPGGFDPGGSQTKTLSDPEDDGGSSELDFPENPDASDPDPEPETETSRSRCPECGSGNFASSDLALEKVPNLSERAKKALKAHDYHCHDCGEVFDL
jgi:hypothetical protein